MGKSGVFLTIVFVPPNLLQFCLTTLVKTLKRLLLKTQNFQVFKILAKVRCGAGLALIA